MNDLTSQFADALSGQDQSRFYPNNPGVSSAVLREGKVVAAAGSPGNGVVSVAIGGDTTGRPVRYIGQAPPVGSYVIIAMLGQIAYVLGAAFSDTDWQVPTFTNGWVDAGAPRVAVGYRRSGIQVFFRGTIASGTLGLAAFTLPLAYRPVGEHTFVTTANHAFGDTQVQANGAVIPLTGSTTLYRLDGVSFFLT